MCYIHYRKDHMKSEATYSPVKLRISAFSTCKHNIEHKEGKQYAEHSDKFQKRSRCNKAVLFFLCRLNQSGKHNADAKKIAYICKVHIEVPAYHIYIVEDTQTCNAANKAERTVNCLKKSVVLFCF